jgi:hypothetical protein
MLEPPEKELEEVAICEYIILLPISALRQIYNNLHRFFSEERYDIGNFRYGKTLYSLSNLK